ncbi:ABC transporter substrate-binding protein [Candidatus Latescibacterota bacterium]
MLRYIHCIVFCTLLIWPVSNSRIYADDADDITAESLFRRGLIHFNDGKLIAARLDFSEIVSKYKSSPRISSSHMLLSKIFYALGEYDEAISVASEIRRTYSSSPYGEWANYMIGACSFRKGNHSEALAILARLAGTTRDNELKNRSMRALRYAVKPKVSHDAFASVLMEHGIAVADLEGLEPYRPGDETGTVDIDLQPEPDVDDTAETGRIGSGDGSMISIGVLAPLTGPNSQQGNRLVKGVEQALNERSNINGKRISLIIEDTESDIITAAMKMRKLAGQGVIAVIGPVYGESTVTSALEANNLKIPFLAPTAQTSTLTSIGEYIFQVNLNPVVQAEALATLAVDSLEMSYIAVIATKDTWGETIAETFHSEVLNKEGTVIKTAFVDQNVALQDFNPIIMGIRENAPFSDAVPESTIVIDNGTAYPDTIVVKLDPEAFGPQRLVPISTIDGILISALSSDAALIAQHISDYNVSTTLLGDSGWSSSDIAFTGGEMVNGSYIVSSGHNQTGNIRSDALQDVISLKGYDTCALILKCIADGADDSESLVRTLETVRDFMGASMRITIDPDRHFNTAVDFVQIQDGTYTRIPRTVSSP